MKCFHPLRFKSLNFIFCSLPSFLSTQASFPPSSIFSSFLFHQSALESLDIALVVIPSAVFLWHVPHIGQSRLNAAAVLAKATARAFAVAGTPLKILEAVGRDEPRLFRALFPGWIAKPHAVFPDIHDKRRSEFVRRFAALACIFNCLSDEFHDIVAASGSNLLANCGILLSAPACMCRNHC